MSQNIVIVRDVHATPNISDLAKVYTFTTPKY